MSDPIAFMNRKITIDFTNPNTFHDRIVNVNGTKFYVVAGVLSMWSEEFRRRFYGNPEDSNNEEINISCVDAYGFNIFIHILYEQNDELLNVENLIPMMDVAFMLLAPTVLNVCKRFIYKNFDNLDKIKIDLLNKAGIYGMTQIKTMIVDNLMSESEIGKYRVDEVLHAANQNNLDHLKAFMLEYMCKTLTFENCSEFLDLLDQFNLKKDDLIKKIGTWEDACIEPNLIIELSKCAIKYNIQHLQMILRKRIFRSVISTNNVPCINYYMKQYHRQILSQNTEVRNFIVISTFQELLE